jgi:hypothetical protein
MKFLRFIIIIFISLSSGLAFAKDINNKEWLVFVKTYGKEKACLFFPDDPKTSSVKELYSGKQYFSAHSVKDGVDYMLKIMPKNSNSKEYFSLLVSSLEKYSNIEMINSSLTEKEDKDVIDLMYKDLELNEFCKNTVILTDLSIYSLFTSFKEGEKEEHNYFISSFTVDNLKK